MKTAGKLSALLLALALLLGLGGCGQESGAAFRVLETVGTRHYGVICRKEDRIAPRIDAAMNALAADGTLAAISVRWLGQNAITLKGAPLAEETEDGAEPPEPRTLIVGVEADFEPVAFSSDGILRGMSVDIAEALGRVLGWEVRYQPISPAEVGTQLSSGNIDCALGFDPGEVSASKYTVGVTYMESSIVLAVRPDSEVRRLRDLKDRRVGTIDDPAVTAMIRGDEKITKYASGATMYLSPQRCIAALDNGWCAAVAVDRILLDHLT